MKRLYVSFSILFSAVMLLMVTAISGTAQNATPTPPPTYPRDFINTLAEINEALNTEIRPQQVGSPLSIAFVANYSFAAHDGTTAPDCNRFNLGEDDPYATVELETVDASGNRTSHSFVWIYRTRRLWRCDTTVITATPTQTYTPSKTPTSTNTPTLTPTIDFTKTTPTPTSTATSTPQPTSTNTPTMIPSPTTTPRPDAVTCEGAMVSRLAAGEQAVVVATEPLNLRESASTSGASLAQIQPETTVNVLEGPECDEESGLAWWKIETRGLRGYIVESLAGEYFLEPIVDSTHVFECPGFMPSRLVAGEEGRVLPGAANNVRDLPNPSGELVGKLEAGAEFTVIEGPECDNAGRAWWKVTTDNFEGWTVEGQSSDYYVEPILPPATATPTFTPTA
jgi:uncharacterized protein YgiM (DUF1202 family)